MAFLGLLGILCVVAINTLAPKIRISAPLLMVIFGIAVAMQPVVDCPVLGVEPEWILAGVLPLLLFAAAVSMPVMNFRRNLPTIAGLSVTLVVLSSLALGLVCSWLLPGLGFAGGIALGAVLSPTDAVATSIVKKLGVAPRVVALLDGEAMLNDASALVLLRAAITAIASSVSIWSVAGKFALSIAIATVIGVVVGVISLQLRRRIEQPTANTLLSFTVPFFAFLPAEHFGASGLVAVVAAGLVVGQGSPYVLPPIHRVSEEVNWRTIEMLLEGLLFLMMGLELFRLIRDVRATESGGHGIGFAFMLAGAALGTTLVVRTLVVVPLLLGARQRTHKYEGMRPRFEDMQHDLEAGAPSSSLPKRQARYLDRFKSRLRRALADVDYMSARPLGAKDGVLLVWAGMRGAITLAAAETLPATFPHRSLVILVAFLVAATSLLLQGGSLAWVIRRLKFPPPDEELVNKERTAIFAAITDAALHVIDDPDLRKPDGTAYPPEKLTNLRQRVQLDDAARAEHRFDEMDHLIKKVFDAQRMRILDARADGIYSAEVIETALERIDSIQLGFQLASAGMRGAE